MILLFLTLFLQSIGKENKCGDNCFWYFQENTLIINGTGEMENFQSQYTSPFFLS